MGATIDPKEHALPDLVGGWSLERYAITGAASVDLFVPREPDALLDDVEVQERNRYNDSMPYWAWVWDSAPVLARQVAEDLSDRSRPARVLEVGAGLGLVGHGVAAALGTRAAVRPR